MALEGNIRFLEKDIEDWLWLHPETITFVDGWIDRQLLLNNGSILDMLGYKLFHGNLILVLIELKSRPLKEKDVLQIGKYVVHLQETIEDIGLISLRIWPILIGVDTKADRRLHECATMIDAMTLNIKIEDGTIQLEQVPYSNYDYKGNAESNYKTGRYDNLIQFLLPEMPDFMQEQYKYYGHGQRSK